MDENERVFFERIKRQNLGLAAVCSVGLMVLALFAFLVS